MPTYNREDCIKNAIDSLLAQTYQRFELIVIDDGSTDGTDKYLKEIYKVAIKKRKIKYFKLRNNKGAAFARNEGLRKAKYNWIGYLDTDNLMHEHFLETFADGIEKNTNYDIFYAQIKHRQSQAIIGRPFNFDELVQFNYIDLGVFVHAAAIYKELGGFDVKLNRLIDWDLIIKYTEKYPAKFIEKILLDYDNDPIFLRISNNASFENAYKRVILNFFKRIPAPLFIEKYTGQIQHLKGSVADLNREISSLNLAVSECEGEIASLKQTMAYRDKLIDEFVNSNSWRITRPLRIVGHQFKRCRCVVAYAMTYIKHSGGFHGILKKIIRRYRREGFAGIKRGFDTADRSEPSRNNYVEWIRRYDTLTDEARSAMRLRIDNFGRRPLISVLMPAYNPKPEWLIEAIESVRKQIYPYWELYVAAEASTNKKIRGILEHYFREDSRIKVVYGENNDHISPSFNNALMLTAGEWVALLGHEDRLTEHALFWVADAINKNQEAKLVYSDEDKIDDSGRRYDPYFKSDWNKDLFYAHNMIAHLGIYRSDLLKEVSNIREGLPAAQDYDLAVSIIEQIEPGQIYHIPRVLYHWRVRAESKAKSGTAKLYAMRAGEKALNEHFKRQGVNAMAEPLASGMYRIRYFLPHNLPLVSLMIPTRNGLQLLKKCIESILKKTTYPKYEILIIDNASDDPASLSYFKEIEAEEKVRIVRADGPFNFSALNNSAIKLARGEIVGLLNNDIEVISPDWLSEMVAHALRPEVGAVGARLWYPEETLQHAGVVLGMGLGRVAGHVHGHLPRHNNGYFGRASVTQEFSAVTAACLVIRKAVYEEVGGFNESDLQVAFNDIDFCLRLGKAGYSNIWTPYAELYHHESATRGQEDTPEKRKRFENEVTYMKHKWGNVLLTDPAYSPNLSLDYADFSLAWPPRVDLIALPHAKLEYR